MGDDNGDAGDCDGGASKRPRFEEGIVIEFISSRQKLLLEDAEIEVETLAYNDIFSCATKATGQHGYVLLTRDCYKQIWDFALSSTPFPVHRKLTLLGNSGIGKSGMLVYLAYRLLAEGKQVYFMFGEALDESSLRGMLRIDPSSKQELGPGHFAFTAFQGNFLSELRRNRDAYVLVDGYAPTSAIRATCILACTPDRDNYHEWSKNGIILYMPPWSELEVLAANATIYKEETDEIWRRYTIVGGFPLLLFNNPYCFEGESYFQEGIAAFLSPLPLNHRVCQRVCCVHPFAEQDGTVKYNSYMYDYNSEHIRVEVGKSQLSEQRKQMRTRVMASTSPSLQALRGKEAEWDVHELLFKGGRFPYKIFTGQSSLPEKVMTFPEQLPVPYNPTTVHLQEGIYYLPKTGSQAAWDAFFIYNGKLYFVQITVSRLHTKKIIHLQTIMEKARVSTAVLMFAGPPDAYNWFRFQCWNNTRDKPDGLPHDEVEQWAVEFDLLRGRQVLL